MNLIFTKIWYNLWLQVQSSGKVGPLNKLNKQAFSVSQAALPFFFARTLPSFSSFSALQGLKRPTSWKLRWNCRVQWTLDLCGCDFTRGSSRTSTPPPTPMVAATERATSIHLLNSNHVYQNMMLPRKITMFISPVVARHYLFTKNCTFPQCHVRWYIQLCYLLSHYNVTIRDIIDKYF